MKLTQHDCYKTATQHIHEKCFDIQVCVVVVVFLRLISFFPLQNEYVLNKLWIVANLCQVGLESFTINHAVDDVCNALGRQNFEY